MREIALQCRAATIFTKSGEIDEDGCLRYLQRFIDNGIDVYLASGGSGEGHTLAWEELRQLYRLGVAACKGKVQVNANPPDQFTAKMTVEHARLAIEAGVDVVNVYQPASLHGYEPYGEELVRYYEAVLREIPHAVALAPNPTIGSAPSARLVADLCKRFPQIVAINLVNQPELYFLELQAALDRDVRIFVDTRGIPNTLALGAAGLVGGNLNLLPATYRAYADAFARGDVVAMAQLFSQMIRTNAFTKPWSHPPSRAIKMYMTAFAIPGWEGGVREPARLPAREEIERFGKGLLALGVPEFEALASVAGRSS